MRDIIIALNTKRLRKEHDLTQDQAAQKVGISRVAYRNIETGKSIPRADTLRSIAAAFDVEIQALVSPVQRLENTRFRAQRRLNTRDSVLAEVSRKLHDYSDLEKLLEKQVPYALAGLSKELAKKRRGDERAKSAAAKVREVLRLGPKEPIRDICGLLQDRAGVKVILVSKASNQFFGLSVAGNGVGPAIVVNTWERISAERWIFTAAHELGHLVLHRDAYQVDEVANDREEEKESDVFAAHFLMPKELFWSEWGETAGMDLVNRVFKVKRIFRVSYRTVLYRLSESPSIGSNIWVLFQQAYRRRFGDSLHKAEEPKPVGPECFSEAMRAQEPENLSPVDFVEDRLVRLVRMAIDQRRISVSRGAEILGNSLREMRQLVRHWLKEPPPEQ